LESGIVDQDVGGHVEPVQRVEVGQVDDQRPPADLLSYSLGTGPVAVGDHHVGPGPREAHRAGPADAAGAPGHQRGSTAEIPHHVLLRAGSQRATVPHMPRRNSSTTATKTAPVTMPTPSKPAVAR